MIQLISQDQSERLCRGIAWVNQLDVEFVTIGLSGAERICSPETEFCSIVLALTIYQYASADISVCRGFRITYSAQHMFPNTEWSLI